MRCTMLGIDTLTIFLQKNVKKIDDGLVEVKVYAFGSILFSCNPRDVDLVVIFDPATVSVDSILEFRENLRRSAIRAFDVRFDVCLLTEAEARNNSFLEDERAVLIYG